MRRDPGSRIFAKSESFVGRSLEIERLLRHARGDDRQFGLSLLAAPHSGSSELLRQVYDRLFVGQSSTIPFYFQFSPGSESVREIAGKLLHDFLGQSVAFRLRDKALATSPPDLAELSELVAAAHRPWLERLIQKAIESGKQGDERSFLRSCLSVVPRMASGGDRAFAVFDDLHNLRFSSAGEMVLNELRDVYSRAAFPFVMAGNRRFIYRQFKHQALRIMPLSFAEAGQMIDQTVYRSQMAANDQVRDLIAVQLGGRPAFINALLEAAVDHSTEIDSFTKVEQVYADTVFGGSIGQDLSGTLAAIGSGPETLRMLAKLYKDARPIATDVALTGCSDRYLAARVLHDLDLDEFINVHSGSVFIDRSDIVLSDFVNGPLDLELTRGYRAAAVGKRTAEYVQRAPRLMSQRYRQTAALDLAGLLSHFNGQKVAAGYVDYAVFADKIKGLDDDEAFAILSKETETFQLPEIVFVASARSVGEGFDEFNESIPLEIGMGNSGGFGSTEAVVWVVAEIESKLEADLQTASRWHTRLEKAARSSDIEKFTIWLIAPEGFEADASDYLHKQGAYGSSRKQAELLLKHLRANDVADAVETSDDYEFVFPMSPETEMLAAHTAEEIARRHNFSSKSINQIKTALVEACINASEHSLSPDRRIKMKVQIDDQKMTLKVANRGLRVADKLAEPQKASERRGWGLKLIKGLMDDVALEQTDDGSSISMVKLRTAEPVPKDVQLS